MPILRQCHGSDTRHVHAGMRIFQRIASINTVSPAGIAQNWPREVPLLTVLFDKIYVPCRSKCCVTAVPVSSRTAAGPSFGPGTLRSKCCVPAVPIPPFLCPLPFCVPCHSAVPVSPAILCPLPFRLLFRVCPLLFACCSAPRVSPAVLRRGHQCPAGSVIWSELIPQLWTRDGASGSRSVLR
jgi:hypothetical protein